MGGAWLGEVLAWTAHPEQAHSVPVLCRQGGGGGPAGGRVGALQAGRPAREHAQAAWGTTKHRDQGPPACACPLQRPSTPPQIPSAHLLAKTHHAASAVVHGRRLGMRLCRECGCARHMCVVCVRVWRSVFMGFRWQRSGLINRACGLCAGGVGSGGEGGSVSGLGCPIRRSQHERWAVWTQGRGVATRGTA